MSNEQPSASRDDAMKAAEELAEEAADNGNSWSHFCAPRLDIIRAALEAPVSEQPAASRDDAPEHLQDAVRVRRNAFKVKHEGKEIEVVYASFAACIERETNAIRSERGDRVEIPRSVLRSWALSMSQGDYAFRWDLESYAAPYRDANYPGDPTSPDEREGS